MEPTSATDLLLTYGVLGIITVLWLLGWIVSKPANDRERAQAAEVLAREQARADRLEQENAALRDRIEKDVVPLLTRAVDLVQAAARDR